MSWNEINKQLGTVGDNRASPAKRKIDASKKRIFRIATMSCACLLLNTAATVSLVGVLEDWSVSSNLWLACTVREEALTRNWAAYGMHEGSRLNCFSSANIRYLLRICRLTDCCFMFVCHSPPGYELGYPEYRTEEAQDRRRGLLKEACSQQKAIFVWAKWSVFTFQKINTASSELKTCFFFLFPPSSSACYWDPEVTFRDYRTRFLTCAINGQNYSAFTKDRGDFVGHA
jgi:hypothetical protein